MPAEKVVLATDTLQGIVPAITERLGRNGATVAITHSSNQEKTEAVVETI